MKYSKDVDLVVKHYNDKTIKDKCPYCHSDLEATYKTDDDNYVNFYLKCTQCTMTLQGDTMNEIYGQLKGYKPYWEFKGLYYVVRITFENADHEKVVSRDLLNVGNLDQAVGMLRKECDHWINKPEDFVKLAWELNPCR